LAIFEPAQEQVRQDAAAEAGLAFSTPALPLSRQYRLTKILIVLVLAGMIGMVWLSYRNLKATSASERWETHTWVVIQKLGNFISTLKDAETGQRGFIITGNRAYLAPYDASLAATSAQLAELRQLTADNPRQQQRLAALAPLVADRLEQLKTGIALRQAQGLAAASAAIMTDTGKNTMDQIRQLVEQGQAEEAQLLGSRVATREAVTRDTIESIVLSGTLGTLALALLLARLMVELSSRRQAETAQHGSEARYRSLFNSIEEGFCIIEMLFDADKKPIDYRFVEVNPAFERQTGLRNATGKRMRELAPAHEAHWFETYGQIALTGEPQRFVNEARAMQRWFDVYAFRFGEPAGARVAVLFSDITERKLAEEEVLRLNASLEARVRERTDELMRAETALRQSQKLEALGQLTGGVAHDFNNLLGVVSNSVHLLRSDRLGPEERLWTLDTIASTVKRGTKLTSQLLAFARRQPLLPEVFDVHLQVQGVVDFVHLLMGSQMRIRLEAGAQPAYFAEADINQFETALVNLCVNARDAMNAEGEILISVQPADSAPSALNGEHRAGHFIAISVADTGRGIAPDKLEAIFEPFYTTKEVGKGTGLGLSQVFGFAKQSGGEVEVQSQPGVGSVFTLYLTRAQFTPAPPAPKAPMRQHADGQGTSILVVEDNEALGRMTCSLLQALDYRATWAASPAQALELLEQDASRFDLVFSDVIMPGMNGIELGERVRQRHPGLPFVLASGYNPLMAEQARHGFELVRKPYTCEALVQVFQEAMAERALGRATPS